MAGYGYGISVCGSRTAVVASSGEAPITTSRAFDAGGGEVASITGNIPSSWVLSSNVASVIFANNGSLILIGSRALENNSLTSVIIPNSVTSIGATAFYINNLVSVTLGTSLENIGSGAFRSNQLTSITIPINVTTINGSAFRDNINLASVNCYTTYGAFVSTNAFLNTASPLTIHVRLTDTSWTALLGAGKTFQGNTNVTVINDL
jgi:hypothetical protein